MSQRTDRTYSTQSSLLAQKPKARRCQSETCPNRVLVKIKQRLDADRLARLRELVQNKLETPVIVQKVGGLNIVAITSQGLTVENLTKVFSQTTFVEVFAAEYIESDSKLILHNSPSDQFFENQWALRNTGQTLRTCGKNPPNSTTPGKPGADISVEGAWKSRIKPRKVAVAVIDSGINYNHPDLKAMVWNAPNNFNVTVRGMTIPCKIGSHGFNAISNSCDPMDDYAGHGTHVAGILGAQANNKIGVVGVSPDIEIVGVKAFVNREGCASQVADAIDFLVQIKMQAKLEADIRIVNNSYGFPGQVDDSCEEAENCESKTLKEAIKNAGEHGILFVASAGNDGNDTKCYPEYPASFKLDNILSVAATDKNDVLSDFSNYGAQTVHLGAPGSDICSSVTKGYRYMSGTSMAAPFVSGAAALILSRYELTSDELKNRILDNVDKIDSLKGKTITGGRLNVGRAVNP